MSLFAIKVALFAGKNIFINQTESIHGNDKDGGCTFTHNALQT
jgi:hypothetical protein